MNLKLNIDSQSSTSVSQVVAGAGNPPPSGRAAIKEERRRTGRYIAILVGISLLFLALYQAWVRRIPLVASLVVPALIMFLYIAWVLYTASRDKRNRARDLERAMGESVSAAHPEVDEGATDKVDVDLHLKNTPVLERCAHAHRTSLPEKSITNVSLELRYSRGGGSPAPGLKPNIYIKPIILVNDQPHLGSEEQLEPNNNCGEGTVVCGGGASAHVDHKHQRLKTETLNNNAIFRRSYSIA